MNNLRIPILLVAAALMVGCGVVSVTGSGNVVTKEFPITDFDKLDVSEGFQVDVSQGDTYRVVIRIDDNIQLQALAQRMSLKATDVLMKLMELGVSGVHINSTLDADTAAVLASEFSYEVENVARSEDEIVGDARGEFERIPVGQEHVRPLVVHDAFTHP